MDSNLIDNSQWTKIQHTRETQEENGYALEPRLLFPKTYTHILL